MKEQDFVNMLVLFESPGYCPRYATFLVSFAGEPKDM